MIEDKLHLHQKRNGGISKYNAKPCNWKDSTQSVYKQMRDSWTEVSSGKEMDLSNSLSSKQELSLYNSNKLRDEALNVLPEAKHFRKKTKKEIAFLSEQFEKDPDWSRKTVKICKKALNLSTDQIYKWGYDK